LNQYAAKAIAFRSGNRFPRAANEPSTHRTC